MGKAKRVKKRTADEIVVVEEWVEKAKEGKCGVREAARRCGVSVAAMSNYVHGRSVHASVGHDTTLSPEIEEKLVESLHHMETCARSLPAPLVGGFVADMLDFIGVENPFGPLGPSREWVASFYHRHSDKITLRKADIVSKKKKDAATQEEAQKLFDKLTEEMNRGKPLVFNMDETGVRSKDLSEDMVREEFFRSHTHRIFQFFFAFLCAQGISADRSRSSLHFPLALEHHTCVLRYQFLGTRSSMTIPKMLLFRFFFSVLPSMFGVRSREHRFLFQRCDFREILPSAC